MYGAWTEDYGFCCADCIAEDPESILPEYINNPSNALTFDIDLATLGFVQWELNDPQIYEHGWYPGQTDDPKVILVEIESESDGPVEVVFCINNTGQFDIRFSAWVRNTAQVSDEDVDPLVGN